MNPSRGILVWTALAVCAVLVIGAMSWLTRGVLAAGRERMKAETERNAAENRADLEERTRLALWRMDAAGAAIMLRENRTPVDYYRTDSGPPGHPEVLLHFEIRKGAPLVSPARGPESAERLRRLRVLLVGHPPPGSEWSLLNGAALAGEGQWQAVPRDAVLEQTSNAIERQNRSGEELRKEESYQIYSNVGERAQRAKAVAQTVEAESDAVKARAAATEKPAASAGEGGAPWNDPPAPPSAPETGQMRAVWLGGELFLLRLVSHAAGDRAAAVAVQGVWLDRRVLSERLLGEIADLLPLAKLVPAEGARAAEDPLTLVSFPFRLARNEMPDPAPAAIGAPIGAPMLVAWSAVGLALLTSILLVGGVMRLSERRASFVSAVTHELRTPLTTFRLYSDMLEGGVVREDKRAGYLRILSREADRLSHLVENVLAFSRIERGSARANVRQIAAGDLLDRMRDRFESRLATAGLSLVMELPPAAAARRVRIDTAAVEHILFNLIDNSAKYAAGSEPPVVHVELANAVSALEITVRDHGPGIPPDERRRIFRPFHKSACDAAQGRPGVGLGLALSLRLARSIGGKLECVQGPGGACFLLRLPCFLMADQASTGSASPARTSSGSSSGSRPMKRR